MIQLRLVSTFSRSALAALWLGILLKGGGPALAITDNSRDESLPDVPKVGEAGLGAFQVNFWAGPVAPAGTPPMILNGLK